MTTNDNPRWLELANELNDLIFEGARSELSERRGVLDLDTIPYLALCHLRRCYLAADLANRQGGHSVAVCLIRQCVETLSLIDVGLQPIDWAYPLLSDWKEDRKSHGELRAKLEADIWPKYGIGLWDEPWAQYFGNLARAVQPYAHYSLALSNWQFAIVNPDQAFRAAQRMINDGSGSAILLAAPDAYDTVKASMVTLLLCLSVWTLARLLLESDRPTELKRRETPIREFGAALSRSRLLDGRKTDWSSCSSGHHFFSIGI